MRGVIWIVMLVAVAVSIDRFAFDSRHVRAAAVISSDMKAHLLR
jgi:hypothetical protein